MREFSLVLDVEFAIGIPGAPSVLMAMCFYYLGPAGPKNVLWG